MPVHFLSLHEIRTENAAQAEYSGHPIAYETVIAFCRIHVRPGRFELPTYSLSGNRSYQTELGAVLTAERRGSRPGVRPRLASGLESRSVGQRTVLQTRANLRLVRVGEFRPVL